MARVTLPSAVEAVILDLLSASTLETYGLELVKRSDGKVKRGTVYVTLQRMEEKGFVESRQEDTTDEGVGAPRRLYRITGFGRRALAARAMFGIHACRATT